MQLDKCSRSIAEVFAFTGSSYRKWERGHSYCIKLLCSDEQDKDPPAKIMDCNSNECAVYLTGNRIQDDWSSLSYFPPKAISFLEHLLKLRKPSGSCWPHLPHIEHLHSSRCHLDGWMNGWIDRKNLNGLNSLWAKSYSNGRLEKGLFAVDPDCKITSVQMCWSPA